MRSEGGERAGRLNCPPRRRTARKGKISSQIMAAEAEAAAAAGVAELAEGIERLGSGAAGGSGGAGGELGDAVAAGSPPGEAAPAPAEGAEGRGCEGGPQAGSTESGGGAGQNLEAGEEPGGSGDQTLREYANVACSGSEASVSGSCSGSEGTKEDAADSPSGGPGRTRDARTGEGLPPGSVKLFVGGLSWDTTEAMLWDAFGECGGEKGVLDVVVMRDKGTGKPRGFGFVTVANQETADLACAAKHTIDGRVVEAKVSVPPGESHGARGEVSPAGGRAGAQPPSYAAQGRKIFVGGLSPETTDEDFRCYFESFGDIVESQIMQDHMTGRSRGFGFITYAGEEAVRGVFTHGRHHEIRGKQVEVKAATPRKLDSKGGGRAGGGGRGDGKSGGRGGAGMGGLSVGLANAGGIGLGHGGRHTEAVFLHDQFGGPAAAAAVAAAAASGGGGASAAALGGYQVGSPVGGGYAPYGMYAPGPQGMVLPHAPGMAQGYPTPPSGAFPIPTVGTPPGYSFLHSAPAEAYGGSAGAPQIVYGAPSMPMPGTEGGSRAGLQPGAGHWVGGTSPPVAGGFAVAPGGVPVYMPPPQSQPPVLGAAAGAAPQEAAEPPPKPEEAG